MILKKIEIQDFGPFKEYTINFPKEEDPIVLLTGRNNEGKTTLINALKYINNAAKVVGQRKQRRFINDDPFFEIFKQDYGISRVGRLIHDYKETIASIRATFENDFVIIVYFDPFEELIYADYEGKLQKTNSSIFGFVPPLGPLAEREELISNIAHLKSSLDTSLAPRHLRNHFRQFLSEKEFELVQKIIKNSWKGISLLNHEIDYADNNRLQCFYLENRIQREISWAGQGLQVWFQIITHLVRLQNSPLLVLDEPEINLYPEKQNDLLSIINQYFSSSVIIATHSTELINNAYISHIVNVQKGQKKPKIKSTSDKLYLEKVRSSIGSHFNFFASQFEEVKNIIFTENVFDFKLISEFLPKSLLSNSFNIPLHGFHQYSKAIFFKEAYELLIGKKAKYIVILDRDYYPENYLAEIKDNLAKHGISVIYTIGKEIENIFLNLDIYKPLFSKDDFIEFEAWFNNLIESNKNDYMSDYSGISIKYRKSKEAENTVLRRSLKIFEKSWKVQKNRVNLIPGKKTLKLVRKHFKDNYNYTLSDDILIDNVKKDLGEDLIKFIELIKSKTI